MTRLSKVRSTEISLKGEIITQKLRDYRDFGWSGKAMQSVYCDEEMKTCCVSMCQYRLCGGLRNMFIPKEFEVFTSK